MTIEFLQERALFVFLFLSDLTAVVAELTARNFLIFEPKQRKCLIPLGEVPHFLQQNPAAFPVAEPDVRIRRIAAFDGSAGTHFL